MFRSKIILALAVILLSSISILSQSFTYSGPTTVTIPYGSSNVNGTYYFSYQNLSGLCYPCLVVSVDNQVISNSLCDNPSTPGNFTIGFTPGSHTVKFKLLSINCQTLNCYNAVIHQEVEFTVTCNFQISVENIFGGGSIYANGNKTSPAHISSNVGSVSIGAIAQSYDNYNWVWNTSGTYNSEWVRKPSGGGGATYSTSQNTSYSVQSNDLNTAVEAGLRKVCNLEFISAGGTVYVNGSHSSPYTAGVVEQNSVYATGGWYSSNGIEYNFDHWVKDGQSFSSTIAPSAHGSYTAVYVGKPTNTGEYAGAYTDVGDPIVVTWVDNPNTAVNQFQIWRKVKHDGVTGSPVLLTTVGRGVQTYTDYEYAGTDGYTDDLLWYDVRAYYSTDGTYSDADYQAAFGAPSASTLENNLVATLSNEIPAEYSISNYPNPFNPTTTINYQLPQDGFVTIKVYDMLGKEIATLVDGSRTAGYHNVNFDASRLTSGIYIYTINTSNPSAGSGRGFVQSKKMILMK